MTPPRVMPHPGAQNVSAKGVWHLELPTVRGAAVPSCGEAFVSPLEQGSVVDVQLLDVKDLAGGRQGGLALLLAGAPEFPRRVR